MQQTIGSSVLVQPGARASAGKVRRRVRAQGLWFPRDPYRVALFLLTLIEISRFHQHFSIIARFRPALLLFILAAAYAVIRPGALAGARALRPWPVKALAALGAAVLLSVLFGISMGRAGKFVLDNYVQVFIYTFLIMLAVRDVRDLRMFTWAWVASLAFLVYTALFVFTLQADRSGAMRLNDMYSYDANDLGTVLVTGLPFALVTIQAASIRGQVFSAVVILGVGAALAKTGSRGAFLGFLAVGVGIILVSNTVPVVKRIAFVAVALLAMAVAAPPGYWERMQTLKDPKNDYNWDAQDGRRQIAIRGLGYMLEYPLFGIGVNNFPMAEGTISSKAEEHVLGTGIRWAAAHNTHVEIAAELGVTGLSVWTVLMLGGLIVPLRLRRRMPRTWARGSPDERFLYLTATYLPVSFLGFIVAGTFVSFAYLTPVYVLIGLLVGLQVCVDQKLKDARALVRRARRGSPASLSARRHAVV